MTSSPYTDRKKGHPVDTKDTDGFTHGTVPQLTAVAVLRSIKICLVRNQNRQVKPMIRVAADSVTTRNTESSPPTCLHRQLGHILRADALTTAWAAQDRQVSEATFCCGTLTPQKTWTHKIPYKF